MVRGADGRSVDRSGRVLSKKTKIIPYIRLYFITLSRFVGHTELSKFSN